MSADAKDTPGEVVREFYRRQGDKRTLERLTQIIKAYICHDEAKDGHCPHGACQQLNDVLHAIKKELK